MKRVFLFSTAILLSMLATAQSLEITRVKHAGPFMVSAPFMADSTGIDFKKWDAKSLLELPISSTSLEGAQYREISSITENVNGGKGNSLNLIGFVLQSSRYTKATINIEGVDNFQIYHNGKKINGKEVVLEPATHDIAVRYLSGSADGDLKIGVTPEQKGSLTVREDGKRSYTILDVLHGKRLAGVRLSPSGKYVMTYYATTLEGGKSSYETTVKEVATQRIVARTGQSLGWMPVSDRYYYTREAIGGKEIVTIDPATGKEEIFANSLPNGYFQIAPTEDYLLYTLSEEGPVERKEIYQVLEPDDRQPGWRERSYIAKYDLATGVMQPVTFGYNNTRALDISADGRYALVMKSEERLTKRPTSLYSVYKVDLESFEAELIVEKDGFINAAQFSPDGSKILVCGSPEAFDGIGKNVKEGQTPNMYDYQLYIIDLANGGPDAQKVSTSTKIVRPMTKDFNPNVQQHVWSKFDNQIYFTAENRDLISLYKMDPESGRIEQLHSCEDLVNGISLAKTAPIMAYYGQGASNSDRSYLVDLKKRRTTLLEDLSKEILEGIELGECIAWDFTNSKGDIINGRYYLPPHFDPSKKYPLIVNYYGGCSPTSRNFESRYPHHAYAALGYVVYVVNPSGATGFGQEFAARHVNTAGQGPAEDIIEGTKAFCKAHPFVNDKKIGCIGASYGGFMTQYLQTQTDIFAAAISHAGISDHTSYWGEGYWGYSYSEVSMANSYPWSNPDLYVKQSPLFNAHKINTPLLFVHGDSDKNVPVGESIQMFTALKLLGKETAMVLVTGQDHHIKEYGQRIQWQNTIWAWFAKWLQDDPTWWDAIYTPKNL